MIDKQLGNYRIIAKIASGGFASVFKGEHIILTERIVAIKVLHARLNTEGEREKFLQEAQLLEKLKHPYILPILDAGLHEGFPYLVTEYASGSLSDYLKERKRQAKPILPLQDALTILSQIGRALCYAHQHNIVHRDLKPDNILFNARGEAVLADFGIATMLDTARTQQVPELIGTPYYMAPEQFDGLASTKSDQYALGVIAYELLTGQQPFSPPPEAGDIWLALAYQHKTKDPIPPTQLNTSLPLHVEQAILKAMAKKREERHGDIHTFLEALGIPSLPQTSKDTMGEDLDATNVDEEGTRDTSQDIPPSVKKAITELDSPSSDVRKEAIATLTQINHPAARQALIEALKHPTKDVRIQAALSLAQLKDLRVIPALLEVIANDEEAEASFSGFSSINELFETFFAGSQQYGVDRDRSQFETDHDRRRYQIVGTNAKKAYEALRTFGDEKVPILLKALNDDNKDIRWAAANSLTGCISPTKAVAPLCQTLHDKDVIVRREAASTLGSLSTRVIKHLNDTEVKTFLIPVMSSLLPLLQDNDEQTRIIVIYPISTALPGLLQALQYTNDVEIRRTITNSIASAVTSLFQVLQGLRDDSHYRERIGSLKIITDSVPYLLQALQYNGNEEIRRNAAWLLASALPGLLPFLQQEIKSASKQSSVFKNGFIVSTFNTAMPILRKAQKDRDEYVRERVTWTLTQIKKYYR